MAGQLTPEAIVALRVLKQQGQSNRQIARTLRVSEAAIRYHLGRQGHADGRKNKPRKADALAEAIDSWIGQQQPARDQAAPPTEAALARPVNVLLLHEWLVAEHNYAGSYKSVLRFVRHRYPRPRLRPYRRVETPPGAQAQVDWGEFARVDVGQGPQSLYGFLMVLSHSRKEALVWCRSMDQLAWHHAHNESFRRLGGVPAVLRIDNLKTGVGQGAGPWGRLNEAYQSYARALGFHIDACLPRCPEDKGKVENKVGAIKRRLRLEGQSFAGLPELQAWTDSQLEQWARRRLCPITGDTVEASWRAEQGRLRALPLLPLVFDVALTRKVQKDCTINFEGRTYSVPFAWCGLTVEVRGCAEVVQVLAEGSVVAEHPRHSRQRLLLDPSHYQGQPTQRVLPPVPLGKMGQKLQQIAALPVEQRPLDLYAALAEVAR
jgi:transposase